jgi:putative DNA primase/helicase
MQLKYDNQIIIATGLSARTVSWKNTELLWSKLVERLCTEHKTNETYKEYIQAKKEDQSKIKDVGGYVGGYLLNGKRSPKNVVYRQLITLDIDFAYLDFWTDFTLLYNNAAVLHSTHKHCESDPRFRLIMPISREVNADEYVAISRKIAGVLGIEIFDNTTFETNRLMFWPSNSIDTTYYSKVQDGPWIDADEVLNSYINWKDSSLWPTSSARFTQIGTNVDKQQDPSEKSGIVGLFCKSYSIIEAIQEFLQDVYTPTTIEDRYSYIKGSTSAGLMIYGDKFAFSHHGTDPCTGRLCNAFDLVRIHKFGHLDEGAADSNTVKAKSFAAMDEMCRGNVRVKKTIAYDKLISAKYDFNEDYEETVENHIALEQTDVSQEDDVDWMSKLEANSKGDYLSSASNISKILAYDSRLKLVFKQNLFDNKKYIFKSLPWRRIHSYEPIKDVDFSGVRNYVESLYGVSSPQKVEDAMKLEFEKNSFHPIKEYLNNLTWDGTQRIDTLLVNFFGAEDNIYTREAIRKSLVGGVARVFNPGCKFDLVLVLVGPQGTFKSTFFKKLGKQWFSDTFLTVSGKDALEQIQGAWIIEMAELSGMRKADIETTKHFITKQEDTFRPAYARVAETYKRQCIFVGTTNEDDFLADSSGNRRFNPIKVVKERVKQSVFEELDQIVDQIWAEAVYLYNKGEKLILSNEAEFIAKGEQLKHSKVDDRTGVIEHFLDIKLPENWDERDIYQRRLFLDNDKLSGEGTIKRDVVCMGEIWCECLGKNKDDMDKYKTREINEILKSLPGWEYVQSTKNFKNYGKQRYYQRKLL